MLYLAANTPSNSSRIFFRLPFNRIQPKLNFGVSFVNPQNVCSVGIEGIA